MCTSSTADGHRADDRFVEPPSTLADGTSSSHGSAARIPSRGAGDLNRGALRYVEAGGGRPRGSGRYPRAGRRCHRRGGGSARPKPAARGAPRVVRPREAPDARRQVRVRLPAGEHPPASGTRTSNQRRKNGRRRPRGRVISGPRACRPAQHAAELAEALEVGKVADAEADVPRRTRRPRTAARARPLGPTRSHRISSAPARASARRSRDRHPAPTPLRLDREIAGAAARVEHAVARPDDLGTASLRQRPVEAGRHDAVHRVVNRRDAIEHPAHRVGLERAGLVRHSPQRLTRALSIPIWSRQRATMKSTGRRSSRAPW